MVVKLAIMSKKIEMIDNINAGRICEDFSEVKI